MYGDPPEAEVYGPLSALRLQVQPSQTEVFVDGYYAGSVREFDGLFERLRLESGEHDIELYLQGYKSVHQKIYLQPDNTFRIRHTMQALASGEAQEPRPIAPPPPPGVDPGAGSGRRPAGAPMPWPGERAPGGSARGQVRRGETATLNVSLTQE